MVRENIDIAKLQSLMARRNAAYARLRNLTDRFVGVRDELMRQEAHLKQALREYGKSRSAHLEPEVNNLRQQKKQIEQRRDEASAAVERLKFVNEAVEYARRQGIIVDESAETAFRPAPGTPGRVSDPR